ncbi:collagen-like protein [Paenibacillus sinopodophylli]|uniref:collagen-like protein n=1 Tax=Paenibacillus sinopodophylli TaxID=1837342 RepID=UPI00110D1398|nr:collagen-like protein [Paenibacillus sinopodophylli]
MSYSAIKKRCKRKPIIVCHPNEKKKKRHSRIIKKKVCLKCPPLNGQQLLSRLAGAIAEVGPQGLAGALGPQGLTGLVGAIGSLGPQGLAGLAGALGAAGLTGLTGPAGPVGPAGGVLAFADFFALMPLDNAATVAPNTDVSFPQDGPFNGTAITRINASSFNLASIGTYQVSFQVNVNEAGQLILTLNGTNLAYTVVGRATGTSQIVGIALVQTTVINSVLTVRNPAGNSTALTITPLAGGTWSDSAHLVIMQIA